MTTEPLIAAARTLASRCNAINFCPAPDLIYNPLDYAWAPYEHYLKRYGAGPKRNLFIGINPGPWGMVQTGIPFGEINTVKNYLKISGEIKSPATENPVLPVKGYAATRSEVSGKRLWGMISETFPRAEDFFANNLIFNYCPLFFSTISAGKRTNLTPDKINKTDRDALYSICDDFIITAARLLTPQFIIGIGGFAQQRLTKIFSGQSYQIESILHPSPLNAQANKDFNGLARKKLYELGAW